jgi:hypothetical protein
VWPSTVTFGAVYYHVASLGGVLWLKTPGLASPLVYLNEALRAS